MEDARTWYNEVAGFCPGIGRGKQHSPRRIRALLDEQRSAPDD
jgi:hypothetical protein